MVKNADLRARAVHTGTINRGECKSERCGRLCEREGGDRWSGFPLHEGRRSEFYEIDGLYQAQITMSRTQALNRRAWINKQKMCRDERAECRTFRTAPSPYRGPRTGGICTQGQRNPRGLSHEASWFPTFSTMPTVNGDSESIREGTRLIAQCTRSQTLQDKHP